VGSKYTKRYSDEYKRDAIELVRSSGRTVTDVARELGVSSESLRGWVKKARAAAAESDAERDEDGRDEELKRLRRLTAEQAKTIEILKKATLDSTGQGNALGWCVEPQALARTVVELRRDGVKVVLAEGRQVCAFR
jgi:transposase